MNTPEQVEAAMAAADGLPNVINEMDPFVVAKVLAAEVRRLREERDSFQRVGIEAQARESSLQARIAELEKALNELELKLTSARNSCAEAVDHVNVGMKLLEVKEADLAAAQSSLSVATKDAEENSRLLVEARAAVNAMAHDLSQFFNIKALPSQLPGFAAQKLAATESRATTAEAKIKEREEQYMRGARMLANHATVLEEQAERYRAEKLTLVRALELELSENKKLQIGTTLYDAEMFLIKQCNRLHAALASPARTSERAKQGLSEQVAGAENAAAEGKS